MNSVGTGIIPLCHPLCTSNLSTVPNPADLPVRVDLRRTDLLLHHCFQAGERPDRSDGACSSLYYLFRTERHHPAGDCLPRQSLGIADAGGENAGRSAKRERVTQRFHPQLKNIAGAPKNAPAIIFYLL